MYLPLGWMIQRNAWYIAIPSSSTFRILVKYAVCSMNHFRLQNMNYGPCRVELPPGLVTHSLVYRYMFDVLANDVLSCFVEHSDNGRIVILKHSYCEGGNWTLLYSNLCWQGLENELAFLKELHRKSTGRRATLAEHHLRRTHSGHSLLATLHFFLTRHTQFGTIRSLTA